MMKKIYQFLASLDLGLWLMAGVMLLLAAGSFVSGEESRINDTALLTWLFQAPPAQSWWLWGTVALLILLALNTLLCGWETLRRRFRQVRLMRLLAPQLMHAGFLFIMLAHLSSASASYKGVLQVMNGSTIDFADGSTVVIESITGTMSPMGFPSSYRAALLHRGPWGNRRGETSPNHPYFHDGFGIYLKQVQLEPGPFGLVEIHREPGAPWALAGAVLFLAGNMVVLRRRKGQ